MAQVLVNLLGPNNFTSDKNKVKEAIRLFLQGMSHRKIADEMGCAIGTVNRVLSQFSTAENWDTSHIKKFADQVTSAPRCAEVKENTFKNRQILQLTLATAIITR